MINKRLIKMAPDAIPHIKKSVLLQITSLISSILLMLSISFVVMNLVQNQIAIQHLTYAFLVILVCIAIRFICTYFVGIQNYLASKSVKPMLRSMIFEKVLKIGTKYNKKITSAELLQISVEGTEQLETYFGAYLPQFFYSIIAPLILFSVVSFINLKVAIILFVCVPLIPLSIILIQKFAKKLLSKYWGEYAGLADNFLENLQGLNTLKIYSSDKFKHTQMNKQAQRFRIVTMKVLSMQLNSIIIMDIVAYGGAALGIIFACNEFALGTINLSSCLTIILLSAEFFLPLRILGSFFHIAMNGLAASKKIFDLLDLQNKKVKTSTISDINIKIENLSFSYDKSKQILQNINLSIPKNSFISIVGESGCGKSTIAGILMSINENYCGSVKIGNTELCEINEKNLYENISLISANSYIFKGTVKDNLLIAKANASDNELWALLEKVNLKDFLKSENGLETIILENASNLSGGQCQRLSLARALLHNSNIYIFDEATSNIDTESENKIMEVLHELRKTKTIILISHRLANVVKSDLIYVLKSGEIKEYGTHEALLQNKDIYENLYTTQEKLEEITR